MAGQPQIYRPDGGYARIATIVKQIRAESQGRILFCDCGDTIHGTYPALDTQGQALIPILNSLELDAMTAHWGFAFGPKVFNQRVAELNCPMLANNVYDKEAKKPVYQSYAVKEIGGLRIGLGDSLKYCGQDHAAFLQRRHILYTG